MALDIVAQAKQGNPKAIAVLLNRNLQGQGITAHVSAKPQGCLHILLEGATVPDATQMASFIQNGMNRLRPSGVQSLHIYGRDARAQIPDWSREVKINPQIDQQGLPNSTKNSTVLSDADESISLKKKSASGISAQNTKPTVQMAGILKVTKDLSIVGIWNLLVKKLGLTNVIIIGVAIVVPIIGFIALLALTVVLMIVDPKFRADVTKPRPTNVSSASSSPSPSPKTPEILEVLDTPVGPLPVRKWVGESCLYANATEAHIQFYGGQKSFRDQLKKRYNVTCVLVDW